MRLVLFLFTSIMHIITSRYNNLDWFDTPIIDLLVQILHVITLLSILYVLIIYKYVFLSLYCAYVLLKNIKWLLWGTNNENDDEDVDDENTKER